MQNRSSDVIVSTYTLVLILMVVYQTITDIKGLARLEALWIDATGYQVDASFIVYVQILCILLLIPRRTRLLGAALGLLLFVCMLALAILAGDFLRCVTYTVRTVLFMIGVAVLVPHVSTTSFLPWASAIAASLSFGMASIYHHFNAESLAVDYSLWGMPRWLLPVTGYIDGAVALLLLVPRTRGIAVLVGMVVLAGAFLIFASRGAQGVFDPRFFSVAYYWVLLHLVSFFSIPKAYCLLTFVNTSRQ